ncbi:MAG: monovalent cation/H(+) antiporter subunit G [Firmicutes bacterium]|nr:monovalent cation/H(+) antiporter subunit G [Bacillota bacterium]
MFKIIAYICFVGSVAFFGLGTLGLFKFPDPYTRMHAVGMGDTLGVGLIGLGLLLLSTTWILRLKLIIALSLFWLINPTMTHLTAKAALIRGIQPVKNTEIRRG